MKMTYLNKLLALLITGAPGYVMAASGVVVGVPSWALGVAVVIVIGWFILKFIFSVGESVVDSAQMHSAKKEDENNFIKFLRGKREEFSDFIATINRSYDNVIGEDADLESLKKEIIKIFNIEIYDNRHLMNKTFKNLEDELIDQIKEYGKLGGVL